MLLTNFEEIFEGWNFTLAIRKPLDFVQIRIMIQIRGVYIRNFYYCYVCHIC